MFSCKVCRQELVDPVPPLRGDSVCLKCFEQTAAAKIERCPGGYGAPLPTEPPPINATMRRLLLERRTHRTNK